MIYKKGGITLNPEYLSLVNRKLLAISNSTFHKINKQAHFSLSQTVKNLVRRRAVTIQSQLWRKMYEGARTFSKRTSQPS